MVSGQPGRSGSPGGAAAALTEASRLTHRDHQVLALLAEHRVMTADQLARCCFPNPHRARHRLLPLTHRGVLTRFRRYTPGPGSTPFLYALGVYGSAIHAAATGAQIPTPSDVQRRLLRLQQSASLDHRLGVVEFFSLLTAAARRDPDAALITWWSESAAAGACGDIVRPDGYAEWAEHDTVTGFFFEHDTGSESLPVILDKITRYADLAAAGISRPVLISLPNQARESNLHRTFSEKLGPLIRSTSLVIATTHSELLSTDTGPAGPIWWPAGTTTRRRLAALGAGQPHPG